MLCSMWFSMLFITHCSTWLLFVFAGWITVLVSLWIWLIRLRLECVYHFLHFGIMFVRLDKHFVWNFDRKHILVICHFVSVVPFVFFYAISFGFADECALCLEASLNVRYSVSCTKVFVFMYTWNFFLCPPVGFRLANLNHSNGLVWVHVLTWITFGHRSFFCGIEGSLCKGLL